MRRHQLGYLFIYSLIFLVIFHPRFGWTQVQDSIFHIESEELLFIRSALYNNVPLSLRKDTLLPGDRFLFNFDALFQKLPGILSTNQENPAQDLRVNIRGYGSRAAFGIRGIKILLDGIPMTSPDGTSQVDELSMFMLSKIQVATTNLSSSLGNGGGGTMQLTSLPFEKGASVNFKLNSYKGFDFGGRFGMEKDKGKYTLLINHHSTRSLRQHASGQNTVFYNKNQWILSPHWSLESIIHGYNSPEGQDPGALTQSQFEENPLSANPTNLAFNAGEEVSGFTLAAKSLYARNDQWSWKSILFLKNRHFIGRLAFKNGGFTTFNRIFSGWANDVTMTLSKISSINFATGWSWQQDHRKRFENLSGVKGLQDTDQLEKASNLYLGQHYNLSLGKWSFWQSFRLDYFLFSIEDLFPSNGMQNGQKNFHQANGSFGIQYAPAKIWKTFVNVNTGFETPTLQELSVNPANSGGFNENLKPEKSWQIEWGNDLQLSKKINIQGTLFYIRLNQVISGYELENMPGRIFYRNYLHGNRKGGTVTVQAEILSGHHFRFSYEYADYRYTQDATSATALFFQPLIPVHRLTFQYHGDIQELIHYSCYSQWYSGMYLNDTNTRKSPAQWGLQGLLHTGQKISARWTIGIQLQNIFDWTQYSNFRLNAAGERFYEAASPFGMSAFLQWKIW